MRYVITTVFVLLLILANIIFYAGGEPKKTFTTTDVVPNCGLVNAYSEGNEYHFKCGLKPKEMATFPEMDDSILKSAESCRVKLNTDGFIDSVYCKKEERGTNEIDLEEPLFYGSWLCSGLDGFGGVSENYLSELNVFHDGTFNINLSAKENTDSVWHVKDSIISGKHNHGNDNEIIFTPESWTNDLIDVSGLTLNEAPKYMPVNTFEMAINLIKGKTFGASYRTVGSAASSNVQCSNIE